LGVNRGLLACNQEIQVSLACDQEIQVPENKEKEKRKRK